MISQKDFVKCNNEGVFILVHYYCDISPSHLQDTSEV